MDLRRLRVGEWIVGVSGVALLVSLFLDWYEGASGWEAFGALDVILFVVALSAIGLAVATAFQDTPAIPIALASLVTLLAFGALVLVVFRAIDPPGRLEVSGGIWVALVSVAALLAGSIVAIRDQRPGAPARPVQAEELPAPGP
jgi:hypothetical protein